MKQESSATAENLDGLIERIQVEGVEAARKKAEEVVSAARKEAGLLVQEAEERARQILARAEDQARAVAVNSRQAQQRATRDLLLSVRGSLLGLLQGLVRREIRDCLRGEALEQIILAVARAWMEKFGRARLEVVIGEKDQELLTNGFLSRLQLALRSGVSLKVHPELEGGFQVREVERALVLDFSDAALAEALGGLVQPRFADLFRSLMPGAGEHDP